MDIYKLIQKIYTMKTAKEGKIPITVPELLTGR